MPVPECCLNRSNRNHPKRTKTKGLNPEGVRQESPGRKPISANLSRFPHVDLDLDLDLDLDALIRDTFSKTSDSNLVNIKFAKVHVGQDSPSPRRGLGRSPRAVDMVC